MLVGDVVDRPAAVRDKPGQRGERVLPVEDPVVVDAQPAPQQVQNEVDALRRLLQRSREIRNGEVAQGAERRLSGRDGCGRTAAATPA